MKKKLVCFALVLTMIASMITGCKSGSSEKSEELNLFVWTEYVPDSVIEKFEKEYGIEVNVSTFSTNEDMLAKVKSESEGTYDIVQPSDYIVESMIAQELLEELDQAALTNLNHIGAQYLNPDYDPGNVYSIPYQGGVAAIGVNTSIIKDDITSYDDLFNPAYADSLVVLDDYRATIGMTERSMGISVNESDVEALKKVSEKLLTLKDIIKIYDSDSPKSALISGECSLAYCWSAEIALAMEENPDIKIVYPSEGAFKFLDNWCIVKGSKNYDNAMKFINFMCEPEVAEMVMAEFPYMNCNQTAIDATPDYANNVAKNVPAEVYEAGERDEVLDNDTIAIYDKMWTQLKQ